MSVRPKLAVLSLVALCHCGSATQVERDSSGGTIAIHGERHESMKEARELMLEHCRGPYQIIEEGEMKVGASSRKEWRLRYRCGQQPRQGGPDRELPPSPDDGYPRVPDTPAIDAATTDPSPDGDIEAGSPLTDEPQE